MPHAASGLLPPLSRVPILKILAYHLISFVLLRLPHKRVPIYVAITPLTSFPTHIAFLFPARLPFVLYGYLQTSLTLYNTSFRSWRLRPSPDSLGCEPLVTGASWPRSNAQRRDPSVLVVLLVGSSVDTPPQADLGSPRRTMVADSMAFRPGTIMNFDTLSRIPIWATRHQFLLLTISLGSTQAGPRPQTVPTAQ